MAAAADPITKRFAIIESLHLICLATNARPRQGNPGSASTFDNEGCHIDARQARALSPHALRASSRVRWNGAAAELGPDNHPPPRARASSSRCPDPGGTGRLAHFPAEDVILCRRLWPAPHHSHRHAVAASATTWRFVSQGYGRRREHALPTRSPRESVRVPATAPRRAPRLLSWRMAYAEKRFPNRGPVP